MPETHNMSAFEINKRILVVEDNIINQMLVKHTLQKTGARLDFAEDGKIALNLLRENRYDLVLMDLQLPEMDGYETTYFVRNEMNSDVPIIAMTAMMFNGEEEKCLSAGMNGYIAKPFTLEAFLNGLEKTFNRVKADLTCKNNVIYTDGITIDLCILYDLAGDDELYLRNIVKTFLLNMPETIAKIKKAYEQQDWEAILKTTHFSKSSLSIINVRELLDAIKKIEYHCKHSPGGTKIGELIQYLEATYARAESLITEHFFNNKV